MHSRAAACASKVGKGRHVHVRAWPRPHVARGRKTLQMHGFPTSKCHSYNSEVWIKNPALSSFYTHVTLHAYIKIIPSSVAQSSNNYITLIARGHAPHVARGRKHCRGNCMDANIWETSKIRIFNEVKNPALSSFYTHTVLHAHIKLIPSSVAQSSNNYIV